MDKRSPTKKHQPIPFNDALRKILNAPPRHMVKKKKTKARHKSKGS